MRPNIHFDEKCPDYQSVEFYLQILISSRSQICLWLKRLKPTLMNALKLEIVLSSFTIMARLVELQGPPSVP